MRLPRIYQFFQIGEIITIDDARERLQTSGNTLRKRLSELSSQGYLLPIRQGMYRLQASCRGPKALSLFGQDTPSVHPFAIAAKLTPACHLMFRSALSVHAGVFPVAPEQIFVGSTSKFNDFSYKNYEFCWCATHIESHFIQTVTLSSASVHSGAFRVNVVPVEWAIVDCLRRPSHAPALFEFLRLCVLLSDVPNVDRMVRLCELYGVAAVFNRLGYFLELFQSFWDVPDDTLGYIFERASKKHIDWPQARGQWEDLALRHTLTQYAGLPSGSFSSPCRWRISWVTSP